MIDLIDNYGYKIGKASYLTENDSYITQYRNVYQMIWLKKGTVQVSLANATLTIEENDCVFFGLNEMFRLTSEVPYKLFYIQFTQEFYCRTESDRIFLERCSFFNSNEGFNVLSIEYQYTPFINGYVAHLKQLRSSISDEVNSMLAHNTVQRMLLFTLSMNIEKFEAYNIQRLPPHLQQKNQLFNELLKNNIKSERTVQFYADNLNIHVNVLKNICKQVYGITPKKLIAIVCVNEIKVLLKHTALSVKEIAYELNFDDTSNFIRYFKTVAGMSPAQYREQVNQLV